MSIMSIWIIVWKEDGCDFLIFSSTFSMFDIISKENIPMLNYLRRVITFYEASRKAEEKKCHCEAIKKSHWELMCELKIYAYRHYHSFIFLKLFIMLPVTLVSNIIPCFFIFFFFKSLMRCQNVSFTFSTVFTTNHAGAS